MEISREWARTRHLWASRLRRITRFRGSLRIQSIRVLCARSELEMQADDGARSDGEAEARSAGSEGRRGRRIPRQDGDARSGEAQELEIDRRSQGENVRRIVVNPSSEPYV